MDPAGYRIIERDDRVCAVTTDDVEICGAYQSTGGSFWLLYGTVLLARKTGMPMPPHNACPARTDALSWVATIACLFVKAA